MELDIRQKNLESCALDGGAFSGIGLSHVMAPINLMMTWEKGGHVLMTDDAWQDIEFEVAPDSGSVVHVCAPR